MRYDDRILVESDMLMQLIYDVRHSINGYAKDGSGRLRDENVLKTGLRSIVKLLSCYASGYDNRA